MTEELERLAKDAAEAVCRHLPYGHTENDGGGEYISFPVKAKKNPREYVIAFVPTRENGADANWTVQNNEYGWSWDSETLTATSNPEEVAAWIQSCADDYASKVNASEE